jgi:hypothetical protein
MPQMPEETERRLIDYAFAFHLPIHLGGIHEKGIRTSIPARIGWNLSEVEEQVWKDWISQ